MDNVKTKSHAFGVDVYFLGKGKDGMHYWLEAARWECDWYYGLGYVETYQQNWLPEKARGIDSHQHFDGLFFKGDSDGYTNFNKFFQSTPLSSKELWTLCELMKTSYILREYSDTIHRGSAHYSTNPCAELIKNVGEYDRINKVVLPAIFAEVYRLLSPAE